MTTQNSSEMNIKKNPQRDVCLKNEFWPSNWVHLREKKNIQAQVWLQRDEPQRALLGSVQMYKRPTYLQAWKLPHLSFKNDETICAKVGSLYANLTYPNVHSVYARDVRLEKLETLWINILSNCHISEKINHLLNAFRCKTLWILPIGRIDYKNSNTTP